jgi:hypothetical protein
MFHRDGKKANEKTPHLAISNQSEKPMRQGDWVGML